MNDPYVYNGTTVLKNKLDIKDETKLEKAESDFLILAISNLKQSNFKIDSIFDILKIHKALFSNLYEWAGKVRTIDIYKSEALLGNNSIDYVYSYYINIALKELDNEFTNIEWDYLSPKEKINKICYFISEFWHIHPFREGNTRTTAMALYFLIKKAKLHINIDFLNKNGKYFRNALVLSCLYNSSKPQYLLGIVYDSTTLKNEKNKKYAYSNHTINKLKTIKKPKDWKR